MRYMMIISYDGSNFYGFQRQKQLRSVQEELEKHLSNVFKEDIKIKGAGRTDAGVHAIGQVIHFDSEREIPIKNLKKHLNKKIFPDIYIKDVNIVTNDFHSRISSIKKEYHYIVSLKEFNPLEAKYKHFFHNRIDIEKIKYAMKFFMGTHDFKAFTKNNKIENTIRTIETFELINENDELCFIIIGNGFMYNMVRIMIAVLLKVGEGKISADNIPMILETRTRKLIPFVAPPNGLYLWKVYYD